MPEGLRLAAEKQLPSAGGAVVHAIRQDSAGFSGFAEAYFSLVDEGAAKDWKRHERMTLNLVVPVGSVAFMLGRDLDRGAPPEHLHYVVLGPRRYLRLTVAPGWFMSFAGLGPGQSLVMNVADLQHDPAESLRLALGEGPALPDLQHLARQAGVLP